MVKGDWRPLKRRNLITTKLASDLDSRGWPRECAKDLTIYHWNRECNCFVRAQMTQLSARARITVTKLLGKLQTIMELCLAGSAYKFAYSRRLLLA